MPVSERMCHRSKQMIQQATKDGEQLNSTIMPRQVLEPES